MRNAKLRNHLNLNLNRSRRKSFAVQENKKLDMPTLFSLYYFLSNFHVYVERKDIRVIDFSASERQNCLLHFVIARVPSSLIPA